MSLVHLRQVLHKQCERICFKGLEVLNSRCTGERSVVLALVGVSPDQNSGNLFGRGAGLEDFEQYVGPPRRIGSTLTDAGFGKGRNLVPLLS